MKLGETKEVFAWLPIRRMERAWSIKYGRHFRESGAYWLRRVKVTKTFSGLVAYASDNDRPRNL